MDKIYRDRTSWSQLYTTIFNDINRKLRAETKDIGEELGPLRDRRVEGILERANREVEEKSELASRRQALYNSDDRGGPVLINCVKEFCIIKNPSASSRNSVVEDRKEKHSNRSM